LQPKVGDGPDDGATNGSVTLTVMMRQWPLLTVMPTGAGERPEPSSTEPEGRPPTRYKWTPSGWWQFSGLPGGLAVQSRTRAV